MKFQVGFLYNKTN